MTVLSVLRNIAGCGRGVQAVSILKTGQTNFIVRNLTTSVTRFGGHGHRTMVITPSRYQWQKYKDVLHFYIFLGVIPCLAISFYANVFIGPAKLAEIPEGYEPNHWEYQRHPISRFFARYITTSYQEDYERNLHYIKEEDEQMRMRVLSKRVEKLMKEKMDYPNYFNIVPIAGKYIRASKEETDLIVDARGND